MKTTVAPTTDSGETAVEGIIRAVSRDTIALIRNSLECGDVTVHFPRVGYRVMILD